MCAAQSEFHGIYPMLYAFFDAEGGLDRSAMRQQIEFCVGSGVQGLAVLGLATEVDKLTPAERLELLHWTAADLGGRLPLAVTVFGNSVEEQVAFVQAAAAAGADWVILQPPRIMDITEADLIAFFDAVMKQSALPVAIQNAPEYIGIGLSAEGIESLRRDNNNFVLLKAEGSALTVKGVIEATGDRLTVFNGRNGLELPDNLRAGCAGMIPGPETAAVQARIYELMQSGDLENEAEAERLYRAILPTLTYVMQSLDTLHCYGKRLVAWHLGLDRVYDRSPGMSASPFGLSCLARFAADLDRLSNLTQR